MQGVGFRRCVYRLASDLGLAGWVTNTVQGVIIEVEGVRQKLDTFLLRLEAEYDNPLDRRFHAQPNACPICGPHLELWDSTGACLAKRDAALGQAANAIRCGMVVAVKGPGGFQLLVDARDQAAVARLRRRKAREEKPFALMFPTLEAIRSECAISPLEARLLRSPEAPIVLLRRGTSD